MRGYYGEGLKLAASYLTIHQIPVYLFTQKTVFRFIVLPKDARNPGIFILLGRSKEEVKGTKIFLFGYKADPQFIKKMVRFWNKELQDKLIVEERFSSEDCPREMVSAMFDFPNQHPNSRYSPSLKATSLSMPFQKGCWMPLSMS